jgi:hypothetical protein
LPSFRSSINQDEDYCYLGSYRVNHRLWFCVVGLQIVWIKTKYKTSTEAHKQIIAFAVWMVEQQISHIRLMDFSSITANKSTAIENFVDYKNNSTIRVALP